MDSISLTIEAELPMNPLKMCIATNMDELPCKCVRLPLNNYTSKGLEGRNDSYVCMYK